MSKVSLHLMHHVGEDTVVAIAKKIRPSVIKALSGGDYLARLADRLKGELDYEPRFVQRVWFEARGIGHPNIYQGATYAQYRQALLPEIQPAAGRNNFYFESYNETGLSPEYMRFEANRAVGLKNDFNLRIAACNPAVGWTTDAHFQMAQNEGLISALNTTGGAWAEHGYGPVLGFQMYHGPENQGAHPDGRLGRDPRDMAFDKRIWPDTVNSWLMFRSAMSHQSLKARGGGGIPIILTEFGFDDGGFQTYRHYTGGQSAGAWRECIPHWQSLGYLDNMTAEQFYGWQLAWAEKQASIYNWLMGMTVFTVGSDPQSRWSLYDVLNTAVLDHFMNFLPGFDVEQPEPDPDDPDDPPELPDGCWVQAVGANVNVRQRPTINAPIVGKITAGAPAIPSQGLVQDEDPDPGRLWHKLDNERYAANWVLDSSPDCELIQEEGISVKFTPIYLDPTGSILDSGQATFNPPLMMSLGDPNTSGDTVAALQQHAILWWWFQWNAAVGDTTPDCGDMNTFMEKMRGQSTNQMVNSWFDVSQNDQYINAIRQETFKDNQPTGSNPIKDNEWYNPWVYLSILNGDAVPLDMMPAFLSFTAEAMRQLHDGRIVNGWNLAYGLGSAILNMDPNRVPDLEAFWEQAENRDVLEQAAATDSIIVFHSKVTGRFQDHALSEVFPVQSFAILEEMGWLDQLRFFLRFEYADGRALQGLSENDVLSDMWLLEKTAQGYDGVDGWGMFLHRNPDDNRDWVLSHDITALESSFLTILEVGGFSPEPEWQDEPDPDGPDPDPDPDDPDPDPDDPDGDDGDIIIELPEEIIIDGEFSLRIRFDDLA